MNYSKFASRWQSSGGAERANYGLFLTELCDLIGVPRPDATTDDPTQDAYVLERAVAFDNGTGKASTKRMDLYKRGCFVLETKQGTTKRADEAQAERAALGLPTTKLRTGHAQRDTARWGQVMLSARQQALNYVRALPASEPRPPFIVVVDVGYCIDLYSNFTGVGDNYAPFPDSQHFRILLPELAKEETCEQLRLLFTNPQQLDPTRLAAKVTRKLAGQLAVLSTQLEKAGHPSDVVASFLVRCLFSMFSEDVGLIPAGSFLNLLIRYDTDQKRASLPLALEDLWRIMDKGGFAGILDAPVPRFNGHTFHEAKALPLSAAQVALLREAAAADWTTVEPAIFGTLLERALDPRERHRLGAHYTPRRYVERLVLPAVMEPLRREWAAAQAASTQRHDEGDDVTARAELVRFLRRLTTVKILDPACGSGNFLYVTLEHLKRLEGEVLAAINVYGQAGLLDLAGGTTVSPRQLLGLEINPRAVAIADVVLRIGYLQWHIRTHGLTQMAEPLLDDFQNIRQQDALLSHGTPQPRLNADGQPVTRWDGRTTRLNSVTGQQVPDEAARVAVLDYPNPHPTSWPEADFIIGNPPFLGNKRMRETLGDGYTEALRAAYKGRVNDSADFVMYWWHKAALAVRDSHTQQFGFITTNSITQTFNRQIMAPFVKGDNAPLSLKFAIPNHPWVDASEGAAVRVAFTVGTRLSKQSGILAQVAVENASEDEDAPVVELQNQSGIINFNLSIGDDLASVQTLKANRGISSRGVIPVGQGFIITKQEAANLGLDDIGPLKNHIRPFRNGKDITGISREQMIIDLFGLTEQNVMAKFPAVYQHIIENVKPQRDAVRRDVTRNRWWIFAEARSTFRPALQNVSRYIVTPQVAKHRLFTFLETEVLPDDKLIAIALDDAYHLGVLSSKVHTIWSLATGGRMGVGNDPVYDKTKCFDPFPFPSATPEQQARIRELAEMLDAHRKRQQAEQPSLTLTNLYNVVEKLRADQPLSPKEQTIKRHGLAAVVLKLHQQLDAAVAEAYGWPATLPDTAMLANLAALSRTRAVEEKAGAVRYLRPTYQTSGQQQTGLDLIIKGEVKAAEIITPLQWPKKLAEQIQMVREVVAQANIPLTPKQVASRFRGVRARKVQPLLMTLASLSLLRWVNDTDTYAA